MKKWMKNFKNKIISNRNEKENWKHFYLSRFDTFNPFGLREDQWKLVVCLVIFNLSRHFITLIADFWLNFK
jgi:hypothetical protein